MRSTKFIGLVGRGYAEEKKKGGLGFHDLHASNLAMLAKKGWRLLNDETSLFYQVLKAKYFKEVPFLQARLGQKPRFTWQTIFQAR